DLASVVLVQNVIGKPVQQARIAADWSSGSKLEVHQRIRYLVFSLNSDICACCGYRIGAPYDAGAPHDSEAIRCACSPDYACSPHNAGAPNNSGTLRSSSSPHDTGAPHHTGRPWISGAPHCALVSNKAHGAGGRVVGHSRRKSSAGCEISAIQGGVEIK